ncbi:hypothetical protein [Candidatus Thiothrix anitrata]|uniref:Restriction endonuclease type II NotI domain-containing protein n=1 Tax=Candidatus Thiothrix anitrata TaxID=2823902 RepID=A0ABX7X1U2_9GAMM|nr:hypothetical protein [Candidatus Thiothrix anitrata]QTR49835.1 hypothetical protein J8380_16680 [Candidatus Thiothrix anitrata]
MPKFYEVYGRDVYDQSEVAVAERKAAYCPFTENVCDGGGNRHQTKIKLAGSELRGFFNDELSSVIPGICSIQYGDEIWVVCPRRLLGFFSKRDGVPDINESLHAHEREALINAGVPRGIELGVWPEVYLQYGDEDSSINYHFDFVIAPIRRNKSFSWLLKSYNISDEENEAFKAAAKIGKYLEGKYSPNKEQPILPDIISPIVIEVMTASTSGSDKEVGTDIAASFADAIKGNDHNCPGINKRQVWGRMATQLFAKSALAEEWGGKTIWLVQDQLLKNIELTTKLNLDVPSADSSGTINFLSMTYADEQKGIESLRFLKYSKKSAGLDFQGNQMATDILLPKVNPDKKVLLKAILRRKLSAIIFL